MPDQVSGDLVGKIPTTTTTGTDLDQRRTCRYGEQTAMVKMLR